MSNTAIAERETEAPVAGMVAMIERLARSPDVDVGKLEKLLEMQERIMARQAKAEYAAALSEMQPSLPVIEKRGRIKISKDKDDKGQAYALWDDINEAIKAVLQAHGFALSFRTGVAADGKIAVTGILSHRAGHQEETTITLPHDSSGSKNAVQAVGSSTSYGKRYTAGALLNLTFKGEDDDGAKGGSNTITETQIEALRSKIVEADADLPRFLRTYRIERIDDLPASQFADAMAKLGAKIAKAGASS